MLVSSMLSVILFMHVVNSVDRSKFNTCSQTPFCQRNRDTNRNEFTVNSSTFKITDQGNVQFVISQQNETNPLTVTVSLILGGKLRFSIREVSPKRRPRYESPNIIPEDLQNEELKYTKKLGYTSLCFEHVEVVRVIYSPFSVEIFSNGRKMSTINGRQLLLFETEESLRPPSKNGLLFRFKSFIRSIISFNWFRSQKDEETPAEETTEEEKEEESVETNQESTNSVGLDFKFHGFGYVYGLPERGSPLVLKSSKNGDPYRMFNSDVFEYEIDDYSMALYGSVPLTILHGNHDTVGLFWLNTAETWVDLDYESAMTVDLHWFSEMGVIDFFMLLGPSPQQVFKQYSELTGTVSLPPLFALGFHQSRWNYDDQEDVEDVSANFEKFDIPLDFIWLDIEHTDDRKYFVWNEKKFEDPLGMVEALASRGRKLVVIVDPHLKVGDYHVFQEAKDGGHLVRRSDGEVFTGWCWPGNSVWPDFTSRTAREWWSSLFGFDKFIKSNLDVHLWVDMNEPSVFNHPEMTLPRDSLHQWEIQHREVHNEYGMLMAKASWEGMRARSNHTLRPFLLGRSFFAGSQRYGAYWTGDNEASWGHLKHSIPMVLSMSISGIVFSGADVGGFFGNPDGELLVRWHQLGAWQPFFRAHAHIDSRRREPWLFSDSYMAGIRNAVRVRYSYLPYWYTLFANSTKEGFPVVSPLWVHFPRDHNTFSLQESFMIGSSILVAPVLGPGVSNVSVYLPGNEVWYNVDDPSPIVGPVVVEVPVTLNSIPTFYRGGSIIPRRHINRKSAYVAMKDPISLTVVLNSEEDACGELYVDDFITYNYSVNGLFNLRRFSFHNNVLHNTRVEIGNNRFESDLWIDRVYVYGFKTRPNKVTITHGNGSVTKNLLLWNESGNSVMVRKPEVGVSESWTMEFK